MLYTSHSTLFTDSIKQLEIELVEICRQLLNRGLGDTTTHRRRRRSRDDEMIHRVIRPRQHENQPLQALRTQNSPQ